MKRTILSILLLFAFVLNGATKEPERPFKERQLFGVFYSSLKYLNERDVETIEGTKDYLTAHNTSGYIAGITYEYTNKKNIVFGGYTCYGVHRTNLNWRFTFEDYIPDQNLGGYTIEHGFKYRSQYLSNCVQLGYMVQLPRHVYLVPKIGLGTIGRSGDTSERLQYDVIYTDEEKTQHIQQFAYTDANAGSYGRWYSDRVLFYSFSIDARVKVNSVLCKQLGFSFRFAHGLPKNGIDGARGFYYNSMLERDGIQVYNNKFRSVGIGVVLFF